MWFEPLAEVGSLLVGCAAVLGVATPFLKNSGNEVSFFSDTAGKQRYWFEEETFK